jgi:HK97 family phage prohead protease
VSDMSSPPREAIRAAFPAVEFRSADDLRDAGVALQDGELGVLRILFSPVNEWTEINSKYEGRFMERFAPGAWAKTIRDSGPTIRALFQHGMDPQVGDKPLGPIRLLEENERGGYAEVALLDTSYNRDLIPGLKADLYGASHRFEVMREDPVMKPGRAPHNPDGLPERTVKEARLKEFGPVTFPAYKGATAGVRSITDDFLRRCFDEDPERLRTMFEDCARPDEERMDSEDAGLLGQMLVLASEYIEEQDEGSSVEAAAIAAMQVVQEDLIKLLNVEAAEVEPPDEMEDERKQDPAPSTADAATSTSVPERRDTTSSHGPLVLPVRTPRSGISLPNQKKGATWPLR